MEDTDTMNILMFLLYALATLGQFSDVRTTEVGQQHGFVEGNPVGRWLLTKLHIQGLYITKVALLPITAVILTATVNFDFIGLLGLLAAVGFVFGIRNYLALKAKGVTFSEIF